MALAGVTLALAERWAAHVAGTVSGHCAGRANLWPLSAFPVHPFGRDAARVGIREQPPPSSVTRTLGRRLTQGHQASRRQSQARARPLSGLGLADWTLSSVSGVNTHRPASKRHTGAQPRRDPATSRALAFPSGGGRVLQGPGPPAPRQAGGFPCSLAPRVAGLFASEETPRPSSSPSVNAAASIDLRVTPGVSRPALPVWAVVRVQVAEPPPHTSRGGAALGFRVTYCRLAHFSDENRPTVAGSTEGEGGRAPRKNPESGRMLAPFLRRGVASAASFKTTFCVPPTIDCERDSTQAIRRRGRSGDPFPIRG